MGNLISLKEWSEKNGIAEVTARQRAARGSFETARKIGRNWVIDEDEKLIDHRFKEKPNNTGELHFTKNKYYSDELLNLVDEANKSI